MSFEQVMEEYLSMTATHVLKKTFYEMLIHIKDSGKDSLSKMFPSLSPETQIKVLDEAWKHTLLTLLNASAAPLSDYDYSTASPPVKKTWSKEEFLAMAKDDSEDLDDNSLHSAVSFISDSSSHLERAEQSILNKFGYSVSSERNASTKERQELLAHLIMTKKVSKGYVISYLDHLIKINGKSSRNYIAVMKWTEDLAFVKSL